MVPSKNIGRFKELRNKDNLIHVVYSPSNQLELFIFDSLRDIWSVPKENIQRVTSIQKIRSLEKSLFMAPMDGDRWLVDIEMGKVKKYAKDIANLVGIGSETSVFLLRVANYGQFKELKTVLEGVGNYCYLAWLNQVEVGYLLDFEMRLRAAQSGKTLQDGMYLGEGVKDFICKGYGSEPDKIMDLCSRIREGENFPDRKSIIQTIGVSAGSIDSLIFNLLKDPPKNKKLVLKNRLSVLNELVEVYGVRRTQSYLRASVNRIKDLKVLWMNGKIYNKVGKDLPNPYAYEELRRYGRRLDDVKSIPLSRITSLYAELDKETWVSKMDIQRFLYSYYSEVLV